MSHEAEHPRVSKSSRCCTHEPGQKATHAYIKLQERTHSKLPCRDNFAILARSHPEEPDHIAPKLHCLQGQCGSRHFEQIKSGKVGLQTSPFRVSEGVLEAVSFLILNAFLCKRPPQCVR